MKKLILKNRLSPGDVLMMTGVVRDLHKAYPNEYQTDIQSPSNEIFLHNPYITPLRESEVDEIIDMHYPLINHSGYSGLHFSDGHRMFLQEHLRVRIPKTSMRPDIFLSQDERNWVNQLETEFDYSGKYWIINAGIKNDYTLKYYPYYQEVVNLLKDKIQFVQVGHTAHNHKALDNVIDMRGKTSLRQLFRLSYHAEGAVCCVTMQMVIMQAFKKPCVVINGGREGMRWQAINDHRFLHTIGALPCCLTDGCWRSKLAECDNKTDDIPKCMSLIEAQDVVRAVELYYSGGRLQYEQK